MSRSARPKIRRLAVVGAYLALLAVLIPWYWPAGDMRLALGFPLWALTSVLALLGMSALTAWVYLSEGDSDE